jgi:hypothetical protein
MFLNLSNNFLMLQTYFMIERMGLGRLSKLQGRTLTLSAPYFNRKLNLQWKLLRHSQSRPEWCKGGGGGYEAHEVLVTNLEANSCMMVSLTLAQCMPT